jgi:hypothetical protein
MCPVRAAQATGLQEWLHHGRIVAAQQARPPSIFTSRRMLAHAAMKYVQAIKPYLRGYRRAGLRPASFLR